MLPLDHERNGFRKSVHVSWDLIRASFYSSPEVLTALKLLLTHRISSECFSDLLKSDYRRKQTRQRMAHHSSQGTNNFSPREIHNMIHNGTNSTKRNWPSSQRIQNGTFSCRNELQHGDGKGQRRREAVWGAALEFAKAWKKGEPCGCQKLKEKSSAHPRSYRKCPQWQWMANKLWNCKDAPGNPNDCQ